MWGKQKGFFLLYFCYVHAIFKWRNCWLQQDSNSDCQIIMWACWPLDQSPFMIWVTKSHPKLFTSAALWDMPKVTNHCRHLEMRNQFDRSSSLLLSTASTTSISLFYLIYKITLKTVYSSSALRWACWLPDHRHNQYRHLEMRNYFDRSSSLLLSTASTSSIPLLWLRFRITLLSEKSCRLGTHFTVCWRCSIALVLATCRVTRFGKISPLW